MQAIKCVVVGDGAVGKILIQFYTIYCLYHSRKRRKVNIVSKPTTFIFRKNMSTYQLHNKCFPRWIRPYGVWQLCGKRSGRRKTSKFEPMGYCWPGRLWHAKATLLPINRHFYYMFFSHKSSLFWTCKSPMAPRN